MAFKAVCHFESRQTVRLPVSMSCFVFVFKFVYNLPSPMLPLSSCRIVDSHTAGEPTRVVISGGPELGSGSIPERLAYFRSRFDSFRSGVVCEPRGSEVVVGALLVEPIKPEAAAAVIFFNDVGYLGMCGHGTIGLITTLAHLGRIKPGIQLIETPVGDVSACLNADGSVTVASVASYRYRAAVAVDVPGFGRFSGDIAWGGNWFFLIGEHSYAITPANRNQLLAAATAVREALQASAITGEDGQLIDHVEFFSEPQDPANSSRNFVLCPGASFDRSPCGTGTSAKMACLYADGAMSPGDLWRQEGILGTVFTGSFEAAGTGQILPKITGKAWITGESTLMFKDDDPFGAGIVF